MDLSGCAEGFVVCALGTVGFFCFSPTRMKCHESGKDTSLPKGLTHSSIPKMVEAGGGKSAGLARFLDRTDPLLICDFANLNHWDAVDMRGNQMGFLGGYSE